MILEKIRSTEQNKPVLTYLCLKVFFRLSYCLRDKTFTASRTTSADWCSDIFHNIIKSANSTFNEKNVFVSLGADQYLLASLIKYLVDCASATLNYKIQ